MNVAFEGVDTVPNIAIPAGDDPCLVTKGYISNLLEITPGDGLACIFPGVYLPDLCEHGRSL